MLAGFQVSQTLYVTARLDVATLLAAAGFTCDRVLPSPGPFSIVEATRTKGCSRARGLRGLADGRCPPRDRAALLAGLQRARPVAARRSVRRRLRQPRGASGHSAGSGGPGAADAAPVDCVPRRALRD